MKDHARENLAELLRRFMDDSAVQEAQADIDAAERILEAHPAPLPAPRTLATIKIMMTVSAARRHRRIRIRIFGGTVAAAVLLSIVIGQHNPAPVADRPGVSFASIIPAAIWESDDLASDDADLAYFTSEIRQIETQMRAVETNEMEDRGTNSVGEIEMELIAIETEFGKGW